MKQRDRRSLLVTGAFVVVLIALIAVGLAPVVPVLEQAAAAAPPPPAERYGPDAQFVQYLEYRVHLENSSNCQ